MKYLIFDSSVSGHHLEYLHHIYSRASECTNDQFVFLLPKEFDAVKTTFIWDYLPNVSFMFLTDEEQNKCDKSNLLLSAWHKSLIIRKYVKSNNVNIIILIMFMHLMPFLPLILRNNVKIRGIIYRLYFYEGTLIKGIRLLLERFRYYLIAKSKNIDKVFVLNDNEGVCKLNKVYCTDKFSFIPDPVPDINIDNVKNVRSLMKVEESDLVYLHFGGLDLRKGTLEILNSIKLMSPSDLKGRVFVFAGKVSRSMKETFYHMIDECKKIARIIVFDEFCSYDFLFDLCYSCDFVLLPYQNFNQSSGVIGYSSFFGKPVIGPSRGLLGRIIKEYSLGFLLDDINPEEIRRAIIEHRSIVVANFYTQTHSIKQFVNVLFD